MSDVDGAAITAPAPESLQSPTARSVKPAYKSWRKKYYKMRYRFHGLMNQNLKRFEEEQKTIRLARRLQEQNDQLLQLLDETNQTKRLPAKFRFDVNWEKTKTPSISDLPNLIEDAVDENGLVAAADLTELTSNPGRSLATFETVPHTSLEDLSSDPKSIEEADRSIFDDQIGYLSPNHEAEYLSAMDAQDVRSSRGSVGGGSNSHNDAINAAVQAGPWSNHDSTGAVLKNPVSVYNWLKKHQPSVFLNDGPDEKSGSGSGSAAAAAAPSSTPATAVPTKEEKHSTTASTTATPRTAPTKVQPKRASVGARHQAETLLDDDEYATGRATPIESVNTGSIRGKRKQVEDEAYRPKGGSSRKRKKLSAGGPGSDKPGETET